ncbi:hypothetical protein SSTG_04934 [Streptomyces sp. e14]|nr:hypothetical protein SSTG_04934 [Streptomyces sp. e14]
MEDLFHVTRRHVLPAVRDQGEALRVERLSARDTSPMRCRVGGRPPLTSTGERPRPPVTLSTPPHPSAPLRSQRPSWACPFRARAPGW